MFHFIPEGAMTLSHFYNLTANSGTALMRQWYISIGFLPEVGASDEKIHLLLSGTTGCSLSPSSFDNPGGRVASGSELALTGTV